jgi:hypothetical protein
MKRRSLRVVLAVASVVLFAGGIPQREVVNRLSVDGSEWLAVEGRLWLSSPAEGDTRRTWFPSAPVIRTNRGEYVAYDMSGKHVALLLTKEKGAAAEWTFEIVQKLSPKRTGDAPRELEGDVGYDVRLRAVNGPFKGWYVSADPAPEPKKRDWSRPLPPPPWRTLKLVPKKQDAVVVRFVEERLWVEHK